HADQTSRHLPDISLARGKKSHMRSAETFRYPQRLRLSSDNVCGRRLQNTQRYGFTDIDDRERLMLLDNRCNLVRILDGSKEIRRLHHHCSYVLADGAVQLCAIQPAIFRVVDQFDFEA